ncbi:MAG TPA: serine hydrolase domain-containing protein [Bryobacteraceae bacterium]|nr:serine hydrolase domain-containing protein [Bryobacteraceae bacterium]
MRLIICLLVFAALLHSQPLPLSTPEKEGLSAERLERLHQRFEEMVRDGKKAGAITMIVRNGRVADWKAYGYRDVAQRLPMEKDTICRIWSMSKVITSAAVMMLVEEGKLALSDPVEKYIPELTGLKVLTGGTADRPQLADAVRPVTVKHLLTHTSGLTYTWGDHPVAQLYTRKKIFDNGSLQEFIGKVASLPLVAQPGEKYNYGISIDVLGYLVQVVSDMPFDKFVQTRILTPLRMNDTFFEAPKEKRGRVAKTYTWKEGKLSESPSDDLVGKATPSVPYGGMGLYSTIGDYSRFGQMLLNGGQLDGVRLLGRKTVELMTVNHLNNLAVPHTGGTGASGFGLGGSVRIDIAKGDIPGSLGEFGWDGAATTYFRMDPKEQTVSLVFFQSMPFDKPALDLFSTLFYQAIVD